MNTVFPRYFLGVPEKSLARKGVLRGHGESLSTLSALAPRYLAQVLSHKHLFLDLVLCPHGVDSAA